MFRFATRLLAAATLALSALGAHADSHAGVADDLRFATALANRAEVQTRACMAVPTVKCITAALATSKRYSEHRDTLPLDALYAHEYADHDEITKQAFIWIDADQRYYDMHKDFQAWARARR